MLFFRYNFTLGTAESGDRDGDAKQRIADCVVVPVDRLRLASVRDGSQRRVVDRVEQWRMCALAERRLLLGAVTAAQG